MPGSQRHIDREARYPKPLRVGLVEDSPVFCKVLKEMLQQSGEIQLTGIWGSGEQAVAELADFQPEIILVDLDLPGMTGEECLRTLSAMKPEMVLVVLTAHDDPVRVFDSIRAGAHGYLLKTAASPSVLLSGIKAAYAGGTPLSPMVARLVIQEFRVKPAPAKSSMALPSLAPRERQILELLAKGQVPKEVACSLNLSYETVRDYLKQIYKKLHVRSRTEAVLKYLDAGNEPS